MTIRELAQQVYTTQKRDFLVIKAVQLLATALFTFAISFALWPLSGLLAIALASGVITAIVRYAYKRAWWSPPTLTQTCVLLDKHLQLKERITSYIYLEGTEGTREISTLLERQITKIELPSACPESLRSRLSKREWAALTASLALCLASLYLNKPPPPDAPSIESATSILDFVEAHPDLPEPIQKQLQKLAQTVKSEGLKSKEAAREIENSLLMISNEQAGLSSSGTSDGKTPQKSQTPNSSFTNQPNPQPSPTATATISTLTKKKNSSEKQEDKSQQKEQKKSADNEQSTSNEKKEGDNKDSPKDSKSSTDKQKEDSSAEGKSENKSQEKGDDQEKGKSGKDQQQEGGKNSGGESQANPDNKGSEQSKDDKAGGKEQSTGKDDKKQDNGQQGEQQSAGKQAGGQQGSGGQQSGGQQANQPGKQGQKGSQGAPQQQMQGSQKGSGGTQDKQSQEKTSQTGEGAGKAESSLQAAKETIQKLTGQQSGGSSSNSEQPQQQKNEKQNAAGQEPKAGSKGGENDPKKDPQTKEGTGKNSSGSNSKPDEKEEKESLSKKQSSGASFGKGEDDKNRLRGEGEAAPELGGKKQYQEKRIDNQQEEPINPEGLSNESETGENNSPAEFKRSLKQIPLSQPDSVKKREDQPIPLEYKGFLGNNNQ